MISIFSMISSDSLKLVDPPRERAEPFGRGNEEVPLLFSGLTNARRARARKERETFWMISCRHNVAGD
jgi:hypothetical protein